MPELSSAARRMSIPGLAEWLASPQARYILDWEMARIDDAVSDIFGFNALQIGLGELDLLHANRIPLRQRAGDSGQVDVFCDPAALPFAAHSIDLVVLPHLLEFREDAHQILREVERILIPEGQVVITGFNPFSLWGSRRRLDRSGSFPWTGRYLSLPRLRDWLQLLGFEPDRGECGCFAPAVEQARWLERWHPIENIGRRWWPFAGGVYILRAIKRTHGMRLIRPDWKKNPVRAKALRPVAQKESNER